MLAIAKGTKQAFSGPIGRILEKIVFRPALFCLRLFQLNSATRSFSLNPPIGLMVVRPFARSS